MSHSRIYRLGAGSPRCLRTEPNPQGINLPKQRSVRFSIGNCPDIGSILSGEFVANLDASHFRLSDNGIEQKVFVEQALNQPLAVVVLMQNGGAASSQLQKYRKLDTMLESVLGSSTRTVALVTFDSRPKEIWDFPPRVDGIYYSLTHQEGGRPWRSDSRCGEVRNGAAPTATGELSPHHSCPANRRMAEARPTLKT